MHPGKRPSNFFVECGDDEALEFAESRSLRILNKRVAPVLLVCDCNKG